MWALNLCQQVVSFLFNNILQALSTWLSALWQTCSQQNCSWWCLCCNKWLCWLIDIILWILWFVILLVFMIVSAVVCIVLLLIVLICFIFFGFFLLLQAIFSGFNFSNFQGLPGLCSGAGSTQPPSNTPPPVASFTIGGTVSGLQATDSINLTLTAGSKQPLTVAKNGSFTFPLGVPNGTAYSVTVSGPPTLICTVMNPSSTVSGANVTNVEVTCTPADTGV